MRWERNYNGLDHCRKNMPNSIFNEAITALEDGVSFAFGVVAGVKGSAPLKLGAKALWFADGRSAGTLAVADGARDVEVQKRALEVLRSNRATQMEVVLDANFSGDTATCGGKVKWLLLPNPTAALPIFRELARRDVARCWGVTGDFEIVLCDESASGLLFRETVFPREQLWIAGAGELTTAVVRLAEQLDFDVTVFDEVASDDRAPSFPENLPPVPTLGLILTHDPRADAGALSDWVQKPFAFLGLMGSRRKRNTLFAQLIEEGNAPRERMERVACPVGLPIGDSSVDEIALSIVAQLVQNRSERRISQEAARNIRSPSLIKAWAA